MNWYRIATKPKFDYQRVMMERGDLRTWRGWAHYWFDKIWQSGIMSRDEAYVALSEDLGLSYEETHMSEMDAETCRKVVMWARPQVDKYLGRMNPDNRERALEGYK